jgi:hypothetical protein
LRSVARWCEERTCPNRAARWYKSIYTEVGGEPAHYSPSNPVLRCALAGARINAGEPFSDFAQCTFISSCPCKAPLDEVEEKMISPRLPHPSIQDQLHTDGTVRECDRMQWAIGVSLVLARDCGGHITASRASMRSHVNAIIHMHRHNTDHVPTRYPNTMLYNRFICQDGHVHIVPRRVLPHDSAALLSTSRPQMMYLFVKCSVQPFMFSLVRETGISHARDGVRRK